MRGRHQQPRRLPGAPPRHALAGRLRGFVALLHPLPAALYVVAVGLFAPLAARSAGRVVEWSTLARTLAAVACAQVAIAALNDYCDRHLDAASKPHKPLVSGAVAPGEALALVVAATAGLLLLGVPLGPVALPLLALIEGLGLAYDLWFKGTPISALLYAVYFPLIPLLAWAVFGGWAPFLPWLLPIGALLGIAMNIANTLPDLEADRAAGMRGLPHLLGLRRGLLATWLLPPAALVLLWALHLSGLVPARLPGLLAASVGALVAVALSALLWARAPAPHTLRLTFYLQAVGVLALATGWLSAVAL